MISIFEDALSGLFDRLNLSEAVRAGIAEGLFLLVVLAVSAGAAALISLITRRIFARRKEGGAVAGFVRGKGFFRVLALVPGVAVYGSAGLAAVIGGAVRMVAGLYLTVLTLAAVFSLLDALADWYDRKAGAEKKSIRGFLRILKIVLLIPTLIIAAAQVMNESPIYIISGLGALSAILLLVFKDAILGMVAGVQMEANDIVRIGDWIEMPKYGADGFVTEVTLTIVKVRNWDQTVTTVPTYALVSDSFKNWRGMFASGGRRIKRALYIDVSTVGFCTEEQMQTLKQVQLIQGYIAERTAEIEAYNAEHGIDSSLPVNGRHMTNIGVFRRYVSEYLKNNPKIHKGMVSMVRQLDPGRNGLPLEIYCFSNDTAWVNFEGIMSDIFDHLFAVLPYFGLRHFQDPSGSDIRALRGENTKS